uniref:G-protein coupled receptors family 1 profile domain-containing protein n=1 Tax=Gadus morhua TaxID=8049 RepID=A0A8C5FPY0_GADMO
MGNESYNSLTLQIEGLKVTEQSVYPVFAFLLIFYLLIIIMNVGILVLVGIERSLHQPMYLLFCNLPINDIIGSSVLVPRLLADILTPPSERFIDYYECVVQAFFSHLFGTTSHTILMIMAYDRYVAICYPLLNTCRTLITHPYCDNASLFKLSCESIFINNAYGLTFTVVLLTSSIGGVFLTYVKITAVCLTSKNKALNSKALKTCSTHLSVYLIVILCGMLTILMHRFPQYSDYRKLSAIMFHIVPSGLNPIIYGVQSKEIRKLLSKIIMKSNIQDYIQVI